MFLSTSEEKETASDDRTAPKRKKSTGTFVIRDARRGDLKGLQRLAAMLNTMNLPNKKEALVELLDTTARSFSGAIADPRERQYLFVAEETETQKLVGTSMIIAQHGTLDEPHMYFEVINDQRYSSSLDKHFRHTILRLGRDFDGPTEIGGLVLDPEYRGGAARLGKLLSYVRFLFIAVHRRDFRKRLLAELLPPLEDDGTSALWEHLGRHFTGLPYQEADHVSRKNKEFITSLFPHGDIYASLLPQKVQGLIGEVGPSTQGVRKMLEDIGFEYSRKIDPFDGGPHFETDVKNVTILNQTRWMGWVPAHDTVAERRPRQVVEDQVPGARQQEDKITHLVAVDDPKKRQKFLAVGCAPYVDLQGRVELPNNVVKQLGLKPASKVYVMPIDATEQEQ